MGVETRHEEERVDLLLMLGDSLNPLILFLICEMGHYPCVAVGRLLGESVFPDLAK